MLGPSQDARIRDQCFNPRWPAPRLACNVYLPGPDHLSCEEGPGPASPKGPPSRLPTLTASIHSAVIIGVGNRNLDVPGLGVNVFVPLDGADLEIAACKMDGEIGCRRNFDCRSKIAVLVSLISRQRRCKCPFFTDTRRKPYGRGFCKTNRTDIFQLVHTSRKSSRQRTSRSLKLLFTKERSNQPSCPKTLAARS